MTQECTIEKIISVLSDLDSRLNKIPPSKKATVYNNEETIQSPVEEIKEPRKSPVEEKKEPSKSTVEEKKESSKSPVEEKKEPSKSPVEEKKPSKWVRFKEKIKKLGKGKYEARESGGSQGGSSRRSKRNIGEDEAEAEAEADLVIRKLQSDIRQMKAAFENLTRFQSLMSKSLEGGIASKKLLAILEKKDSIRSRSDDLKEIRSKIFNLKCLIPSLLYKDSSRGSSLTDSQTGEENGLINENGSDIYLPGLHVPKDLKNDPAFEEVVEKFEGLDVTQKLCLLSFAVFPENKEVKRTMLMYWWIGEDFVSCGDSENQVTEILDEFERKELLEPVENERKLKPNSYKMGPHVHSAVIYLAKYMELFVLYSSNGKLTMEKSKMEKVCLVKGSSLQPQAKTSKMEPKSVKTIFNSSERYPDFTFKWFPVMESLRVLYLGRWERTATRHIEVESTEFLKDIKKLKKLRLASFQGISRIEKLENYICALPKLVILDLRACYNLETLPDDIGSLETLVYLDVSECYMLDRMPEGIANLLSLQVLKGFVISQTDDEKNCAVKHLVKLKKLSITVNKNPFNVDNLMDSLKDLEKLESLKIAWGAPFPVDEKRGDKSDETDPEEGKKREESLKSDKVVEGEKKTSPSRESTDTIRNKPDDRKGESKVEGVGDGDKGKVNQEEGKKQDEVGANKSKSDNGVEEVKKASPSQESKDAIQNKPNDQSKMEKEGDGEKKNGDGNKRDEVEAEISKSDNGVEGDKKASPLRESTDVVQNKPDDQQNCEKQKDKADGEKAESSKPDKVIEGNEKPNPLQKDTVQSKPEDQKEKSKVQKEGDVEKNGDGLRKLDEGEAKTLKSDKKTKFGKKVSFSEEALIQKKPDDLKRDDAMKKESHETASLSRPEKTAPKESGSSKATLSKMWRGKRQDNPATHTSKLLTSLKKLELECFPENERPKWLNPKDLVNLKKLSIRGGKLSKISEEPPTAEKKWHVEIFRLKYLHEFKAEWKDLQALFPEMLLLEKYQCPKVAFCPTDGNGVWRSQPKASPDMTK